MSAAVRVSSPVTTYAGPVGEYVFANGRYDGEISDAARLYFEQAGYTIEPLDQAHKADAAAAKEKATADEAAAAEAQAAADKAAADQAAADAAKTPQNGEGK